MADVHLALQQGTGGFERLVVFKRITDWAGNNEDFLRSFRLEAKVSATMNHANIVQAFDFGEDADGPYLVLEYLSGETLSYVMQRLRDQQLRMPVPLACRIAGSVASALEFVHQLRLPDGSRLSIVHRDVSPSNVMCCYNGQIKLLDFGVAKVANEEPTMLGVVKGKPSYLSPEQVNSLPLDQRTDIFQLGILLWEMLTGQKLFPEGPAAIARIIQGGIEPPKRFDPSIPHELDDLVVWALQHDMEDRCPSAAVFLNRLQSAVPDLFGTNHEQQLQSFMTTTFAERYAERREAERQTYALAPRPDNGLTSGIRSDTMVTRSSTPAPVVLRSVDPLASSSGLPMAVLTPTGRRQTLQIGAGVLAALMVGVATALAVVVLGVVVLGSTDLVPQAAQTPSAPAHEAAVGVVEDPPADPLPVDEAGDIEAASVGTPPPPAAPAPAPVPRSAPRPTARPSPVAPGGDARAAPQPSSTPTDDAPPADAEDPPPAEPAPKPEPETREIDVISDNLNPWKSE